MVDLKEPFFVWLFSVTTHEQWRFYNWDIAEVTLAS